MEVQMIAKWPVVGFIFAMAILTSQAVQGKGTTISAHGKSEYAVVVSDSASLSEQFAAHELIYFIRLASGAEVPLVRESDARAQRSPRFFVGRGKVAKSCIDRSGPVDWAAVAPLQENFLIRTVPSSAGKPDILIIGGSRRGTLFGVYTFLDTLGFRWYTNKYTWFKSDKKIKVLSGNANPREQVKLVIPPLSIFTGPRFYYRYPYIAEAHDLNWAARNRTNGVLDDQRGGKVSMQCHHTFDQLIPPELYKDHPEFFPLIGDRRATGYVQRCLTAPGLVELTAKNLGEWMDREPNQTFFALGQNDYSNICQCPSCSRFAEAEGSQSGLYLDFVNKVAEIVEKKHPDKYIVTFAYDFTVTPPKTVKPRRNVYIQLAPIGICVAHPFTQCSEKSSREMNTILRGWAAKTDRISVWHYCTDFRNLLMPFPDFYEFIPDIKTYYENGVRGIFFQGSNYGPGGGEADLRAWVMARLLWNPFLDGMALVDEYLHGVYGPAYKPMRACFDLIHSRVAHPDAHLHIFDPVTRKLWPQAAITTLDSLHTEALRMADGNESATFYINKSRLAVQYIDYILNTGELEVDGDCYLPAGNSKTTRDWQQLDSTIKKFDVVELREESRDANLLHMLRQRVDTHHVVTIENSDICLQIVPELGGRIVGLIHKKSGINLIHNLDATDNFYPVSGGYDESTAQKWAGTGFTNAYSAQVNDRTVILTQKKPSTFSSHYAPNLLFQRIISIPEKGMTVSFHSTIMNENDMPKTFKLVCRLNFKMDPDKITVNLSESEGSLADEAALATKVLAGAAKPRGVVRLAGLAGGLAVQWRFNSDQVFSCEQNYAKERKLAHFELHSEEREVLPGNKIVIEHMLEIID
jgi:hypothetical protein